MFSFFNFKNIFNNNYIHYIIFIFAFYFIHIVKNILYIKENQTFWIN